MQDFTKFLWLLKLGSLSNIYFITQTIPLYEQMDKQIIIPALVLFAVSAYRCLFPNKYEHNIVFHDTVFSSIFVTRFLATFSEVFYIFLFSYVIRTLNIEQIGWINLLSWIMLIQVVISQFWVWCAILTGKLKLYFYEEFGWAVIFCANTIASAYLYFNNIIVGDKNILLKLNLIFAAFYLPWQMLHLYSLFVQGENVKVDRKSDDEKPLIHIIAKGLKRSLTYRSKRTDAQSWGGFIGLTWMLAYFATLIPLWVFYIVKTLNNTKF
jgi:hypothetical protein